MANAAGMLKESIWRDKDFRALPRTAQTLYAQLLSQKELDRAGVQPLQVSKWAKGCDEITDSDVWDDLKVLEERRFVFVDDDADELFIRSYMRQCEVARYPNILKNAIRCAGLVASEKIRAELAVELRRLRKADATRKADEIDPNPANPSETELNPSGTVPERLNGSETLTEPWGPGLGPGSVTLGSTQVGELSPKSQHDETIPPDQFCASHPDGTDKPCRPCGSARKRRETWDAEASERDAKARAAAVRARRECPACDENGLIELGNGMSRCDHRTQEAAHA